MNKTIRDKAFLARDNYRRGYITRDDAIKDIAPYIIIANNKSKILAKKYNQKFKVINFASFVR